MDALILSCGTGGGHDSAAKAVAEALTSCGHNAVMLNPYTLKSDRLARNINKTYIVTARSAPHVFGAIYKVADLYRKTPIHSPVYFANRGMRRIMQKYISENHYDVIIMTHLFPAEILTIMKRHGIDVPKMIFVATDYVCTPFTEETECDAYVVPADDLISDFERRGIPAGKIYPFGIPTSGCFAAREDRDEVKGRLELDKNKKYILITGGSMGGGRLEKAITKLRSYFADREDIGMIVVCGSNKALYDKLSAQADPQITVVGHTDDMASYMKASNLFITKPGGLSSTEAAVCGIPILHVSPIPGCESCNARYFSERGISIYGEISEETLDSIDKILKNEEIASSMAEAQRKYISPSSASDICGLAEKMVGQV